MASIDRGVIEAALTEFIANEVLLRKEPLGLDEDLFAANFDSMSMTRVVIFVEDSFGVKIPDEELVVDELSTARAWAAFVHKRMV